MKWPDGKRFEDKFVETLKKYGYKGLYLSKDWLAQPAFIQSFAPTSLVYASNLTDLPKILLIDDVTVPTQDTNQVCVIPGITPLCMTYSVSLLTSMHMCAISDLGELMILKFAFLFRSFPRATK